MTETSKSYIARCDKCGILFDADKDGEVVWLETPVPTRVAPFRSEVCLCKDCYKYVFSDESKSYNRLCDVAKNARQNFCVWGSADGK